MRTLLLLPLACFACTPQIDSDASVHWEPVELTACIDDGSGQVSMATSTIACGRPAEATCDATGSDPVVLEGSAEVGPCQTDTNPGCDMIVADCGLLLSPGDLVATPDAVVTVSELPSCLATCGE